METILNKEKAFKLTPQEFISLYQSNPKPMTNEEKIEELAEKSPINWISKEDKCTYRQGFVCGATKIAKWKDEEHAKEKQKLIDEAAEWLKHNIYDYFYWIEMEGESEANIKDTLFDDFKKAMEED